MNAVPSHNTESLEGLIEQLRSITQDIDPVELHDTCSRSRNAPSAPP